jgi:hypothetical protein
MLRVASRLTLEETKKAQAIFGDPSPDTRDKLWRIAVYAFAIVMVGAFVVLAVGVFLQKPDDPVVSGDILLSIFTASVGFFAGLFAPSPGSQQKG